jgi:hypothetical protein
LVDQDTLSTQNSPPKHRASRLGDLGPAWITAIATLIAAGVAVAGFFTGRATAAPAAVPARTVTVTATAHAPSPVATAQATPSVTAAAQASNPGNGSLLGAYTVKLPGGYGIPLATTAPTQSQFAPAGFGDLYENDGGFVPGNGGNKMLSLPGGTTPTYQACASDTSFVPQISATVATAFCIVETGRMVGVSVTAVSVNTDPTDYTLRVMVWQNS